MSKSILLLVCFISLSATVSGIFADERNATMDKIARVTASSSLEGRYGPENIIDGSWRSWSEGAAGNGIGEYFTIEFKETVTITSFYLKNGYGQMDYYFKNNRVAAFEIIPDDEESGEHIEIRDSYEFEYYHLQKPLDCRKLTFKILEVYRGTEYDDTCVAEIFLNNEGQPPIYGSNSWQAGYGVPLYYLQSYIPDPYSIKLFSAMYRDERVELRTTAQGRLQMSISAWDDDQYYWTNVPASFYYTFLHSAFPGTGGGSSYTHYKIFLLPDAPPLLLVVRYASFEIPAIRTVKRFVNDRWVDAEDAIANIRALMLEYKEEDCVLLLDLASPEQLGITVHKDTLSRRFQGTGKRLETHSFLWDGDSFQLHSSEIFVTKEETPTVLTAEDFTTEDTNDGLAITAYNGSAKNIIIPANIGGVPVRVIGRGAFAGKGLQEAQLPTSLKIIERAAFSGNLLENLVIPEGVETIESEAFSINRIRNLTLPQSLSTIEKEAFIDNLITDVNFPASLKKLGYESFCRNKLTSVVIPEGVTALEESVFANNEITEIVFHDNLRRIGRNAFSMNNLTRVVIPDSVTVINSSAFSFNKIREIVFGENVTQIEHTTFAFNEITSLVIPDHITDIGGSAFKNNKINSLTIGSGLTSIDREAFRHNNLENLVIPPNVTEIGSWAFDSNPLRRVTLPANADISFSYEEPLRFLFQLYWRNSRAAGTYIKVNDEQWTTEGS